MPSKYPCCSDCGTKLSFVYSNIKAPNEHRIKFYSCKKCDNDRIIVHKEMYAKDNRVYQIKIIEFVFAHLQKKKNSR